MYRGIEKRHLARLSGILWAPSQETLRCAFAKFGEILSSKLVEGQFRAKLFDLSQI